jgi:hypothetical protein
MSFVGICSQKQIQLKPKPLVYSSTISKMQASHKAVQNGAGQRMCDYPISSEQHPLMHHNLACVSFEWCSYRERMRARAAPSTKTA